jgi:hypothetical protein
MNPAEITVSFSSSFSVKEISDVIEAFRTEGVTIDARPSALIYESAGVEPHNLYVTALLGAPLLAYLTGIAGKAGADTWDSVKAALKRVRAANDGGQDLELSSLEGEVLARYVLPHDPGQRDVAIDHIAEDLSSLNQVQERWWLDPPLSRWGTGEESARQHS